MKNNNNLIESLLLELILIIIFFPIYFDKTGIYVYTLFVLTINILVNIIIFSRIKNVKIYKVKRYLISTIIIIIIGNLIVFLSSVITYESLIDRMNNYIYKEVDIVKIEKDNIIIDYTKFNNDDYKTITIHKPLFMINKDTKKVFVKYKENDYENMKYAVNPSKIEIFTFLSIIGGGLFIIIGVFFVENSFTNNKKRK